MKTFQLPNKWTNILMKLPETGMGYQLVKIHLNNGKVLRAHKVFNASFLVLEPEEKISESEIEKIELE